MLRDLEEMLLAIRDSDSREYMREAVRCYHAGTFRAAVIMAFAATLDGLRRQIASLATAGAPQSIQDLHNLIDPIFQSQKSYESTLIDQLAAGNDLLSPADTKKIASLRDIRNSCGHPSGHRSSAEEARDAIAAGIDIVLSKSLRFGHRHVRDFLQTELTHPNLFPATWSAEQCRAVAEPKLESFGSFAHERLLIELGKAAQDTTSAPQIRNNALGFLRGAIQSSIPAAVQFAWQHAVTPLVAKNLVDPAWQLLLAARSDGKIEAPDTRARIPVVICANLTEPLTSELIKQWRNLNYFAPDEVQTILEAASKHFLSWLELAPVGQFTPPAFEKTISDAIARAESFATRVAWPEFTDRHDHKLAESAGQFNFHICNPAIRAVQRFSVDRARQVAPASKRVFFYSIARRNSPNAVTIKEIFASGFGTRSDFFHALTDTPPTESELHDISEHWRSIEDLLAKSGAENTAILLAKNAMEATRTGERELRDGLLDKLQRSRIAAVKTACEEEMSTSPP